MHYVNDFYRLALPKPQMRRCFATFPRCSTMCTCSKLIRPDSWLLFKSKFIENLRPNNNKYLLHQDVYVLTLI